MAAINVGLIGAGIFAHEHAKALRVLSRELVLTTAFDTDSQRLKKIIEQNPSIVPSKTLQEMLCSPSIDLVVVATPPSTHESIVVSALEAGKYVLCAKPLSNSMSSALRIAETARRFPGRMAVDFQMRYDTSFRRLKWICDNNCIGKIRLAKIQRHSYIPHTNVGSGSWWGSWNIAGGGVLITQLIHEMDLLTLIMGRPLAVKGKVDTWNTQIESEDVVEAMISFDQGRTAMISASVNSGIITSEFKVCGDAGSVAWPSSLCLRNSSSHADVIKALDRALPDTRQPPASLLTQGACSLRRCLGAQELSEHSPHVHLYSEIANCIRSGRALPISVSEAMVSLEICMAIYESSLSGMEIKLPLRSESKVFNGVTKALYDQRPKFVKGLSLQSHETEPDGFGLKTVSSGLDAVRGRNILKNIARRILDLANINPAFVKALIRKPSDIHGGPKVRRWPWPSRRHFDQREKKAVIRLLSQEIRHGGMVIYEGVQEKAYCNAFGEFLGGGYADAVNSGTNALYIALRALDLEPGREVVVPPITDAGGIMPVALANCIPIPADSTSGQLNTCAEEIEKVLSPKTVAIVVAHIGGYPLDMDPILALAHARRIPVVEDCAQAHGSKYKGRMVGTLGSIATFSTMFGKHHCTGAQGGIVFTRDALLFSRVRQLADRGKSFGSLRRQGNLIATLNFNQDEISMAIGRVQLDKLPRAIKARRDFAGAVAAGLQDVEGIALIGDPPNGESSYLFLLIRLKRPKIVCSSGEFATALNTEGIDGVSAGYSFYPTEMPWYKDALVKPPHFELPNAHRANEDIVRVDIHESLGSREAADLVRAVRKLATHFSKT